jgi:hypothetical protein
MSLQGMEVYKRQMESMLVPSRLKSGPMEGWGACTGGCGGHSRFKVF